MYTRCAAPSLDSPRYVERHLFSQSQNRSENAYVNNITDPVESASTEEIERRLRSRSKVSRVLVRSNARDVAYPQPGHFKINFQKKLVSKITVSTCIIASASPVPTYVHLKIDELPVITEASGDPDYESTFHLVMKEAGPGVFVSDNHIHRYSIVLNPPIRNLPSLTLSFRDGLTSELITDNQLSINVTFEVETEMQNKDYEY